MLKLRRIAVTGGLACGKSLVCRFFDELGAYVVSADNIVHQLLSPNTNLGQQAIGILGRDTVVNNQFDRSKIAKKVFNQPLLLESLEHLLHPAVLEEIKKQYEIAANRENVPLFVAEIPLLFEAGQESFFDAIITVIADPEVCKQRFMQSTGSDDEEYSKRAQRQLSHFEKAKRADYVVTNNGSQDDLRSAVRQIFKKYINPK